MSKRRFDRVYMNVAALSRASATAGLLRCDLGAKADLAPQRIADAFAARPVTVRVARKIATALGLPYAKAVAGVADEAALAAAS